MASCNILPKTALQQKSCKEEATSTDLLACDGEALVAVLRIILRRMKVYTGSLCETNAGEALSCKELNLYSLFARNFLGWSVWQRKPHPLQNPCASTCHGYQNCDIEGKMRQWPAASGTTAYTPALMSFCICEHCN